jgi:hypothetical protein
MYIHIHTTTTYNLYILVTLVIHAPSTDNPNYRKPFCEKTNNMYTDSFRGDNGVQVTNNANKSYLAPQGSRKRRKTGNHVLNRTTPIPLCVSTTHMQRELPRPQLTPKVVLASSVLADVYAHSSSSSDETSAPQSRMFSNDRSRELKSTLLNNTTLTIQFSSCILPARDDIQLVCKTN